MNSLNVAGERVKPESYRAVPEPGNHMRHTLSAFLSVAMAQRALDCYNTAQ